MMKITAFLLLTLVAAHAAVTETDLPGAVYLRDQSGNLTQLEQLKFRKIHEYGPEYGLTEQWLLKGRRSRVRLDHSQKVDFVVKLPSGTDPASFSLLVLKGNGSARWLQSDKSQKGEMRLAVPLNITTVGESLYGLKPAVELIDGEYAFWQQNSKVLYGFGLGGEKHVKKH